MFLKICTVKTDKFVQFYISKTAQTYYKNIAQSQLESKHVRKNKNNVQFCLKITQIFKNKVCAVLIV